MGDNFGAPADGAEQRGGRLIGRRTVTRGAVWTAPVAVIATAAPAYATSRPCVVQTNFDGLRPGTKPSTLTFAPSTITAGITYSSTGNGGNNTPGGTGTVASTTTVPVWNYIEVEMLSDLKKDDTITVTVQFSQPVTNLSFKIHDIDTVTGQWLDQVIVNQPAGYTSAKGANVLGTGTSADPFRNATGVDNPISSGLGDVQLSWVAPVQTVVFTYRAGANGNSANQHIGIGNFSFSDCVANPRNVAPDAGKTSIARGFFKAGTAARGDLVEGRDN